MKNLRNLQVSFHDPYMSMIEGIMGRGDEKLAEVPWVWQILLKGFVRLNNLNYKNGQVDLNFYVSNDRHSLFCSDSVSNFLL